jgi:transcriptional regulator
VQAYGRATIYHDSKSEETSKFLSKQIDDLSNYMERNQAGHTGEGDRPKPWLLADAPEKYIEILKKSIIGIEIKIDRLEGVVKMSQEKGEGDRLGVIQGFRDIDSDIGRGMVEEVTKRHEIKKAGQ